MAKLTVQPIPSLARSTIATKPGGIRFNALVNEILAQAPETLPGTVRTSIYNLDALFLSEISKQVLHLGIGAVDVLRIA
jgi:hypothetical protein